VTTWANWREGHPDTMVMVNDVERHRRGPDVFYDDFVIGLVLEGAAKAYAYLDVAAAGVINDMLNGLIAFRQDGVVPNCFLHFSVSLCGFLSEF
jgi:hypothetical protein